MTNEIEKFDPSTLMQGVKDRIKSTFVSLIPEDKWEELVQKEIDSFFNQEQLITMSTKTVSNSVWDSSQYATKEIKQTPFRSLIYEMCYEKTIDLIKKKLTDEWFGNEWPITEENMNENLKKVIAESAPAAMLKFFESISFMHANQLRNDIQQHRI
jgi:hypothetical protein